MGVTPLMWESLNKSKYYKNIWTFPVEWDIKRRNLKYNGISKKLVPWAVSLYLISFPMVWFMFLLFIAPLAGLNKLPLMEYIVNLVWLILSTTLLVGESGALLFGNDAVQVFNCLASLHESWKKGFLLIQNFTS